VSPAPTKSALLDEVRGCHAPIVPNGDIGDYKSVARGSDPEIEVEARGSDALTLGATVQGAS
jgi:hypothetical protein